jgi:hypothetical protein
MTGTISTPSAATFTAVSSTRILTTAPAGATTTQIQISTLGGAPLGDATFRMLP